MITSKKVFFALLVIFVLWTVGYRVINYSISRSAAYFEQGMEADSRKDYDEAIANFTRAVKLNPRNARAYVWRGFAYRTKEDYDKAIADFSRAIRLEPDNHYNYSWRAYEYIRKAEYELAIADLTKAINLSSGAARAGYYKERGDMYRNKEDYDLAIADYHLAIEEIDDSIAASERMYAENPEWFTGEPNHEELYKIRNTALAAIKAIELAIEQEWIKANPDLAVIRYTEAIRLQARNSDAFARRGDAYNALNDYDRAIADYTEAIRLNPNNTFAYSGRSEALTSRSSSSSGGDSLQRIEDLMQALSDSVMGFFGGSD